MSWTMKPKTFSAEVTIMGKPHVVAYDGDSLMIAELTATEALSLVDRLVGGDAVTAPALPAQAPKAKAAPAVKPATPLATEVKATAEVEPAADAPKTRKPMPPLTEEQKAKRVAALAKAREAKAAKAGQPKAQVVNTEAKAEGSKVVEPALAAEPDADEEDPKEVAATQAANASGGPSDQAHAGKLATLSKIGGVVSYLHDAGFHSVADKIAICGRVKDRVPVLQRVPNLDERIGRAQEVMGLDG